MRNNSFAMIDEETLAQMNGKYVMPPDAGPAWRAAVEYGFDMSLIEESLKLTPEQRLAEHQQVDRFFNRTSGVRPISWRKMTRLCLCGSKTAGLSSLSLADFAWSIMACRWPRFTWTFAARSAKKMSQRIESAVKDLHPVHRLTANKLPLEQTRSSFASLKNFICRRIWGNWIA